MPNHPDHKYDRLAQIYDRRWQAYIAGTLGFLQNYMAVVGDESILNVACGTGELERLLLSEHPHLHLVGVDISTAMVAVAQSKFPPKFPSNAPVKFIEASAIALPFADHSFDIVVTASAFHYFDSPLAVLQEMRRVLKPRGRLIVLDWCRDYWYLKVLDLWLKLIDPNHQGCYTQTQLNNFLEQAGLTVSNTQRFTVAPLWGMMVATAKNL